MIPFQSTILYIKATVVFVCVGNAWKILPITARFMWSLYINSVSLYVCDGSFGGWGKGEAGEATGEKSGWVCL